MMKIDMKTLAMIGRDYLVAQQEEAYKDFGSEHDEQARVNYKQLAELIEAANKVLAE